MKGSKLTKIGIAGTAALAVAASAWSLRKDPQPDVAAVPATLSDIEDVVMAAGTLEASRIVSVGAQVSGQIKSLKVQLGQSVEEGDLVAEIDSTTQENAVRDARAALAAARAQRAMHLANAKKLELEFERKRSLFELEAGSRADYERAQADLEYTRAQILAIDAEIEQRRTQLDTAIANLGYTKIRAPMDGVVVAVVVKEGQTVNALQTAPTIVKLAQLEVMTVNAQVSEADVVKVRPGQTAYFTILGSPDKRYYGTLRSIDPAPESIKSEDSPLASASNDKNDSAVYYNAVFEAPNPNGELRIAMTAQVNIVLDAAKDVVTIPSLALGSKSPDGRYNVRVLDRERVLTRHITVGIDNNVHAQVLDGLAPGELVVIGESHGGDMRSQQRVM